MTEVRPTYDGEIDLFEIFKTLWDGKWKIIAITFVAAVIAVVFSVVKPNSFEVSTHVQKGKPFVFLKYIPLSNLLQYEMDRGEMISGGLPVYEFNRNSIFEAFVAEFSDYDEMLDALRDNDFVKQSIKGLDTTDKQKTLVKFAKKFKIVRPTSEEKNWLLQFEWRDVSEGKRLFKNAIQKAIANVQKDLESDLSELAKIVELRNASRVEKLRNKLNRVNQFEKERTNKRLQFLNEQSAIATELGMPTDRFGTNLFSQTPQREKSLNAALADIPFYLRGYKAINKEIELIENRSSEQILLMTTGHMEIREQIMSIENELSASQIRNAVKLIESDNAGNWIEFNLAIADTKSQQKPVLYVSLSIVIGGIIGVINVLISSAIRKRKDKLAKA